jgi:hypothetical protein
MTHVFSQLTPFVFSYPLWIFVSATLWVSGQVTQGGGNFRMYAAFAIVVAAGLYISQTH